MSTLNLVPKPHRGRPQIATKNQINQLKIVGIIRSCINKCMRITANTIRDFLDKQQKHITHYVVAQSHFHTYQKEDWEIERMRVSLVKDLRHARNCFNKELYGNGAKRKPLKYQPLLIPTIEGTKKTASTKHTLHYNIYLGNIPKILTTEDIKELWTYCWHIKAHQSNNIYITEPLANTQSHLLHYGTKETQIGNLSCWDFENTQIPYNALNAD
jgi:hypothetical protein